MVWPRQRVRSVPILPRSVGARVMKRSGLRRPTVEQIRVYEERQRANWKPITRTFLLRKRVGGKRPVRQLASTEEETFRSVVKRRARGRCEACAAHPLPACDGRYAHAHHVVTKARGRGWPGLHDPENGLGVSAIHHSWIHEHPAAATALGFLRSLPVGASKENP